MACLLWPLSLFYLFFFCLHYFVSFFQKKIRLPDQVSVIVVGNLTVGGAGKTPTVLWLIDALQARGLRVGVVSRGYGRKTRGIRAVMMVSLAEEVGDEPLMIHKRSKVPVVVGEKRAQAAVSLAHWYPEVDIIISDDGLTHYGLPRKASILVIDGLTRFGNRFMLPAGPLRAPVWMQNKVTAKLCLNGQALPQEYQAVIKPLGFKHVVHPHKKLSSDAFQGKICYAVAGLAIPEKFFNTLRDLGITVIEKTFPDHHLYTLADFTELKDHPIIMTEKDSVKCHYLMLMQAWYLEIQLEADFALIDKLLQKMGASRG